MAKETLYSTGGAAAELGLTRDALLAAIRFGAPEPATRLAGRRVFNDEDLDHLRQWFLARGRVLHPVVGATR